MRATDLIKSNLFFFYTYILGVFLIVSIPTLVLAQTKQTDLIGRDIKHMVTTRAELMAEREKRRKTSVSPPRPKSVPSHNEQKFVKSAVPLWEKSEVKEDVKMIRQFWKREQKRLPKERQLTNEQFLKLPREANTHMKGMSTQWTQIGSGIYSPEGSNRHKAGRIRATQYVYDDNLGYTTLYVASSGGGLFRWVNAHWENFVLIPAQWQVLSDNLPAEPMVGAFLVDEMNSNRILIATGDYGRRCGTGMYRTLDAGVSWQRVDLDPAPCNFFRIEQDNSNPNTIMAVGLRSLDDVPGQVAGIWRSEDFGASWTKTYNGRVTDLKQDPVNPLYWNAGAPGIGVLESFNNGLEFHPINGNGGNNLEGASTERISYTISESNRNIHYLLAGAPGGSMHGIFRSTNYGYSWTRIDDGDRISWGQSFHTGGIAVDPDDPGRLFVGMGGNQWTDNADATNPADICWHYPFVPTCGSLFDGGHADFHSFTFVPDAIDQGNTKVLLSNDGGVYTYDWVTNVTNGDLNLAGLNVGQHWPRYRGTLSSSWSNPNLLLAGTYDNGVVKIENNAIHQVTAIGGGDGGKVSVSPDDSDSWFVSRGLGWNRVFTENAGANWNDIDCSLNIPSTPALLVDTTPYLATRMYTYQDRDIWYKLINSSCNWERIHSPSNLIGPTDFKIQQLEQNVNDNEYIFYVTGQSSKDLYVIQGDVLGIMSSSLRTPPVGTMTRSAAAAFADKSVLQPETVYYTSEYGRPIQAWMSTNAGSSWENVLGNLATDMPDVQLREMVANPSNLNQIYLATNVGVLRSDDRGNHWYRYMNGLPAVIDAMSIELVFDNEPEPTLYIGSFGRGWWKRVIDSGLSDLIFENGFESIVTAQ